MNELGAWYAQQLNASRDLIVWAASLIPSERRFATPPLRGEGWPAARQIFHLALYERAVALPSMRLWLGGSPVEDSAFLDEDTLWERDGQAEPYDALVERFRATRQEQIALLPALANQWQATRPTVWDTVGLPLRTLEWVVTKTIQHSAEHVNSLLAYHLFWDFAMARRE